MKNVSKTIIETKKLTLLYVEDNTDVKDVTLPIFNEFFSNVIVAYDGEDGFEKFNTHNVDIIITDIQMPKLNGLEMIEKIRAKRKDIPILILSAHNESEYFMRSIELRVDGYLLKPIVAKQFVDVLNKIVFKVKFQIEAQSNLNFLHQYKEVTNHSSIVSKTDIKGVITYVNEAFCKLSGYTKDELIGNSHNIIRHPDNPSSIYKDMWRKIKNKKKIWQGVIRNKAKNGDSYYVQTTVKPILDNDNKIIEYVALRNDITNVLNHKRQLEDFAEATKNPLAVMIKIDGFRDIEKLYGMHIVSKIEEEFAKIIIQNKPKKCEFEKVYSLGYGKYVFIKDKEKCKIGVENVVQHLKKFQKKLNKLKVDVGDLEYDISVIMSLSYGKNVLENLTYGISELQENKKDFIVANGLYTKEQELAQKNMDTILMVKKAIKENKIVSYFQPIINNDTKKVDKYESLVRLIDENNKVISPFFFLDVSKKGKYYSKITKIVLKNSFLILDKIDEEVSINLSALDIEMPSMRKYIFKLLKKYKESASRVVFELLEDESVKDFRTIQSFINDVKKYGAKIAIDDFGAGYSNFERLLDYQPDILKIDGCLIKNIQTDKYSKSIVETIINFAKKQNIKIVAEYVENEDIFNILKELGADYSQGYYFGKPEKLEIV